MPKSQRVNLSAVDLNLLLVFDAVMQERSVTRAGDAVGLSQSAISHALSRLRHLLNDKLFVRSPLGMIPTPRAEHLAGPVRAALEQLRRSLEPETFDPATSRSTLRIAVNNYSALVLVAPIVAAVTQAAPNVMLESRAFGPRGPIELLDRRDCDLVIGSHLDSAERFSVRPLLEDAFVVLMRKDHPAVAKPELSVETFAKLGYLEVTSIDHSVDFIDRILAEHQLKRQIRLRVSYISVARVLSVTDLITLCPRYIADEAIRNYPLTFREVPFESPCLRTSMMWPRQFDDQPSHRWLRTLIEGVSKTVAESGTSSMHLQ